MHGVLREWHGDQGAAKADRGRTRRHPTIEELADRFDLGRVTCDDSRMTRILTVLTVLAITGLALLAAPTPSQACSPNNDLTAPPEVILDHDPDLSPAAPTIVTAEISHLDDSGNACVSGCGQLSPLYLEMQIEGENGRYYARITDAVHGTRYATTFVSDGEMKVYALGYNDVASEVTISVALLDQDGLPSLPVEVVARVTRDELAGCRIGARDPGLPALVFLALLVAQRRRRRTLCSQDCARG